MATETLRPDGELSDSGLVANSELDHDEDPDVSSAVVAATGNNVNTEWGGDFPTPTGNPTVGAGLQEFRAGVIEFDSGQTGTPQARIELWENGSLVRAGSDVNVSTFAVLSFTWDANELATADGSLVQCKVIGTKSGGSPGARNTVNIGHIEWNADFTAGATATKGKISFGELEAPLVPTKGKISFGELETPLAPTKGQISFSELEAPPTITKGQVSFSELETPLVSTKGKVSFAELETTIAPTRGYISFSEAEVPAAPATATKGKISFGELEVPLLSTKGKVSFAELEAPLAPTRGYISFGEMEVPITPTRGDVSFAELEAPATATRGYISFSEMEVPDLVAAGGIKHSRISIGIGIGV